MRIGVVPLCGGRDHKADLSLTSHLRSFAEQLNLPVSGLAARAPLLTSGICVHLVDMRRVAPTRAAILFTAAAGALLIALLLFQQRTRTIEGTWIDLFEGSRFFEGEGLSYACRPKFWEAPWFAYYPKRDSEAGKLLEANRNSGVFISRFGSDPVAVYAVRFEGHHQTLGFGFGHFGASPSEYVVDRMISIKPLITPRCDIRPG